MNIQDKESKDKTPEPRFTHTIAVSKKTAIELYNALRWLASAVSKDETRYFMTGVYVDKNDSGETVLVATDGRRMHILTVGERLDELYKFPYQPIMKVRRSAQEVVFQGEIEGDYPNWKRVAADVGKIRGALKITLAAEDGMAGVFDLCAAGVKFNLNYLKDLADYDRGWRVELTGLTSAAIFDCSGYAGNLNLGLRALIMPMEPDNRETAERLFNARFAPEPEAPAPVVEAAPAEAVETAEPEVVEEPTADHKRKTRYTKEEAAKLRSERAYAYKLQYTNILEQVDNDLERALLACNLLNKHSPCARYSTSNKIVVLANNTYDARSFLEWRKAGRKVSKGAKAFYITAPCIFKETGETDDDGKPVTQAVGFGYTPVFRYEDTESIDAAVPYIYEPLGNIPPVAQPIVA